MVGLFVYFLFLPHSPFLFFLSILFLLPPLFLSSIFPCLTFSFFFIFFLLFSFLSLFFFIFNSFLFSFLSSPRSSSSSSSSSSFKSVVYLSSYICLSSLQRVSFLKNKKKTLIIWLNVYMIFLCIYFLSVFFFCI